MLSIYFGIFEIVLYLGRVDWLLDADQDIEAPSI